MSTVHLPGPDRDRQRIVGGELRKDPRPQRQQLSCAGNVVQVGHRLAGEHRVVVEAALLRAFDLGIPIGALDQPHHQPAIQDARQAIDIADDRRGALLVALDREPKAVPTTERSIAQRRRDHVERQFEPVGFLGIDGEIEVMGFCAARQIDQPRHQLRHHPRVAHRLIARMQRRELYRYAGPLRQRPVAGVAADRFDRAGVGIEIAHGVPGGARAFAEHVVGIARRRRMVGLRPLERGLDGFAQYKMTAHQPHRLARGGAHRRQAESFGQPADGACRGLAGLDHARRHAERPCRRIDQERAGAGLVMDKIALAEPVLDEAVGGPGVRNPQQRLRQHHQREALLGREREFAQHVLDAAKRIVIGADRLDQPARGVADPLLLARVEPGRLEQPRRDDAVVRRIGRGERRRWRRLGRHGAAPRFPVAIMDRDLESRNHCDRFRTKLM